MSNRWWNVLRYLRVLKLVDQTLQINTLQLREVMLFADLTTFDNVTHALTKERSLCSIWCPFGHSVRVEVLRGFLGGVNQGPGEPNRFLYHISLVQSSVRAYYPQNNC